MTTLQKMFERDVVRTWLNVMTIDPGIQGTGMAFWYVLPQNDSIHARAPDRHDVTRPSGTWEGRTDAVCDWLRSKALSLCADYVLIEQPQVWPGSAKSTAAAQSGNLLKLVMLVGGMRQILRRGAEIVLVPPSRWKGQLSKPTLRKRVVKALGKPYREHERDAVGMGLAVQGWIDVR